jgi:hypothetical protein
MVAAIEDVWDEGKLADLITWSVLCESFEGFQKKLANGS